MTWQHKEPNHKQPGYWPGFAWIFQFHADGEPEENVCQFAEDIFKCIFTHRYVIWKIIWNNFGLWDSSKMCHFAEDIYKGMFAWIKVSIIWWKVKWDLFPRFQRTVSEKSFREWFGTEHGTKHFLNQDVPFIKACITKPQWVSNKEWNLITLEM